MWESPACEWEDELILRGGGPQSQRFTQRKRSSRRGVRGVGGTQGKKGLGHEDWPQGRGFKEAKLTESRDVSRVFGD